MVEGAEVVAGADGAAGPMDEGLGTDGVAGPLASLKGGRVLRKMGRPFKGLTAIGVGVMGLVVGVGGPWGSMTFVLISKEGLRKGEGRDR